MLLNAAPTFLMYAHDAGRDHFKDDLQQVPDFAASPAYKFTEEVAEDAGNLHEAAGKVDDVGPLERLERLNEEVGNLRDEADQAREHALKPCPRARDGVGLLHIGPDFVFMNELHEAADEGIGRARHRLAGDGVLAHHGDEQIPARGL